MEETSNSFTTLSLYSIQQVRPATIGFLGVYMGISSKPLSWNFVYCSLLQRLFNLKTLLLHFDWFSDGDGMCGRTLWLWRSTIKQGRNVRDWRALVNRLWRALKVDALVEFYGISDLFFKFASHFLDEHSLFIGIIILQSPLVLIQDRTST